ncbi:MAG: DUF5652 family protein [Patescibacteria group bacterium]|jgi:hypothetical protein
MDTFDFSAPMVSLIILGLFLLAIWDIVWRGMGMWKAAQQKDLAWFICMMIFNTLGILPIVYLKFFAKK